MATDDEITRVWKVLYEPARTRRLFDHLESVEVLMNLDPGRPLDPHDVKVFPGSGPLWFIPATGKLNSSVVEAANRCDKIAALLRETERELADVDFPAADKHHLRAGLAAQAHAWEARASVWRTRGPANVRLNVTAIMGPERKSFEELKHVTKYLKAARMSERSPIEERWLDRLAVRLTRRQMLKGALVGAALTLPAVRPALGQGAATRSAGTCKIGLGKDKQACNRGCNYAAHKQYLSKESRCLKKNAVVAAASVLYPVMGFLYLASQVGASNIEAASCANTALLEEREMMRNCLRPYCPGFNPCAEDGPCDGLLPDVWCCPDRESPSGYTPCAQCCNPKGDGCGSGVTQCGQK